MGVYIWSRLPSAYQEVEYIQSTGNQYIDTGYKYNGTYFRIDFQLMFNSYSYGGTGANVPFICGVIGRSYGNMFMAVGANDRVFGIATGTEMATSLPVQLGVKYNTMLEYKSGTMTFKSNGSTVTTASTGTFYTGKSIPIFCRWDIQYSGLYSYFCTDMRMYGCKIYSAENTLSRDFVPCYRKSDNVIGMYDLVNNQFYTNSGSGTFAKGSDVDTYRESLLKNAYIGEVWTPGSNTLAYYPLATDTKDYSGNGRDGTNNGVTFSDGVGVFNGSSYISLGTGDRTKIQTNMTISVRFKWNGSGSSQSIVDKRQTNMPSYSAGYYSLYIHHTEKRLCAGYYNGSDYNVHPLAQRTTGGGSPTLGPITQPNAWYNLVLTNNGTTKKAYINGTLVATETANSTTTTTSIDLRIGSGVYYDTNSYFNGNISNVIFESKTRTAEEISHYYDITKGNYGL